MNSFDYIEELPPEVVLAVIQERRLPADWISQLGLDRDAELSVTWPIAVDGLGREAGGESSFLSAPSSAVSFLMLDERPVGLIEFSRLSEATSWQVSGLSTGRFVGRCHEMLSRAEREFEEGAETWSTRLAVDWTTGLIAATARSGGAARVLASRWWADPASPIGGSVDDLASMVLEAKRVTSGVQEWSIR